MFDGCHNPLKCDTDAARGRTVGENFCALREIIRSRDLNSICDLKKMKKKSLFVRNDIVHDAIAWAHKHGISVVGAPFEADYQLVQLEKESVTQGTLCEDSDVFVFGSKLMVNMLQFKNSPKNCNIVIREDVMKRKFGGYSQQDFITMCILLGCDYVPRAKGNVSKADENMAAIGVHSR